VDVNASTAQEAEHLLLLFSWRPKMRVRVNLKLINRAYSDCYTASRSQERTFFKQKKRLRQCITHTQGIQIPGTSFFQITSVLTDGPASQPKLAATSHVLIQNKMRSWPKSYSYKTKYGCTRKGEVQVKRKGIILDMANDEVVFFDRMRDTVFNASRI
jgi:hypothetical protein